MYAGFLLQESLYSRQEHWVFSDWIWRFAHWNSPHFPGVHWDDFVLVCSWHGYHDSPEPLGNIAMLFFFLKGAVLCGDALDFESSAVTHVPYVTPDTAAPAVNASPVLKPRSDGNNRDWQHCFAVTACACTVSCSWKWASPKILLLSRWNYHKGDGY